uniref:Uncharacterized protein n=1 Tax=Glossina pallidipes TaxID=7398 RepID=A0A1A9ZJF8_GLOPL
MFYVNERFNHLPLNKVHRHYTAIFFFFVTVQCSVADWQIFQNKLSYYFIISQEQVVQVVGCFADFVYSNLHSRLIIMRPSNLYFNSAKINNVYAQKLIKLYINRQHDMIIGCLCDGLKLKNDERTNCNQRNTNRVPLKSLV